MRCRITIWVIWVIGKHPLVYVFGCAQRTEEERAEARQDAARSATNIDGEERRRRLVFGPAVLVPPATPIRHH